MEKCGEMHTFINEFNKGGSWNVLRKYLLNQGRLCLTQDKLRSRLIPYIKFLLSSVEHVILSACNYIIYQSNQ